ARAGVTDPDVRVGLAATRCRPGTHETRGPLRDELAGRHRRRRRASVDSHRRSLVGIPDQYDGNERDHPDQLLHRVPPDDKGTSDATTAPREARLAVLIESCPR